VPRNRITVRCVPVQECQNGQWVDSGQQGVTVSTEALSELRLVSEGVMGEEIEAAVRRLLNGGQPARLLREQRSYEADPCSCEGTGAGGADDGTSGGTSTGGGGMAVPRPSPAPPPRDCSSIEARLATARDRLVTLETERDAVRRARDEAAGRRARIQREQEEAVREATARLARAEAEEIRRSDYYRILIENRAPEASLDRAKSASDAATRDARQARDALSRARAPREDMAQADRDERRITRDLEAKEGPLREARAEVERIEAELARCRNGL
jgi:hypothetical protein